MDKRFKQLKTWLEGSAVEDNSQGSEQLSKKSSKTSPKASKGLLKTSSWLQGQTFLEPEPASSDASFRRYFRIQAVSETSSEVRVEEPFDGALDGESQTQLKPSSFILMDAPTEHEDCRPFISISERLQQMGLKVPQVLEQDLDQGFLLLTDLGSTTYLQKLNALRAQQGSQAEAQIDELYRQALTALVGLQKNAHQSQPHLKLPAYDKVLLETEMNLFSDWLCADYLQLDDFSTLDWQQTKELLIDSALAQPNTYVHRDYHSRNLMFDGSNEPGVLDFQDAVQGPLTYDAVSLLRDCYIAWPSEQVLEWQKFYFYELCTVGICQKSDWKSFIKAMDLMGVQRHLKAAGIFARLYLRDGKDGYLADIPQTLQYIISVGAQYPELKALTKWVEDKVLPSFAQSFSRG